ncbi:MAG: hypothetical protein FD180_379 [Planctomycetota bacterium]|nr:MAG: hypothetical protein FD180_379 [Planctomycetota bacterium]
MTLTSRIARRLFRWPPERVFSRHDFMDLGTTDAIGMALMRLNRRGAIRRVRRGYFDRPRTDPLLGEIFPSPTELLSAIARRNGMRFQQGPATAANALGMSDQVPMRVVYETDAPSRTLPWGPKSSIRLIHRSPRDMARAGQLSGLLFAALRSLGKGHVTDRDLSRLQQELKPEHRRQLLRDLPFAPAWMHPFLRKLGEGTAS